MRVSCFIIGVIVSIGFIGSPARTQELSHYYTPSGFSFPMLESGEYSLTLHGYSDKYKSGSSAENPDDYNYEYEKTDNEVSLRGTLAISGRFFLGADLYFFPETTAKSKNRYIFVYPYDTVNYIRNESRTDKAYLAPQLSLGYRPSPNLEISIYAAFYSSKSGYIYSPDSESSAAARSHLKSQKLQFNLTYLGKL